MAVSLMCPAGLTRQPCDTTEMGIEVKEKLKEERMETGKEEAIRTQFKSKTEMTEEDMAVIWQGKSLVATRKVEMGEVLLIEAAVLELSPEKAKAGREVERRVEMLGKEELQRLVLLQKRFTGIRSLQQSMLCCHLLQVGHIGEDVRQRWMQNNHQGDLLLSCGDQTNDKIFKS